MDVKRVYASACLSHANARVSFASEADALLEIGGVDQRRSGGGSGLAGRQQDALLSEQLSIFDPFYYGNKIFLNNAKCQ